MPQCSSGVDGVTREFRKALARPLLGRPLVGVRDQGIEHAWRMTGWHWGK
jgi:hypothetical protein